MTARGGSSAPFRGVLGIGVMVCGTLMGYQGETSLYWTLHGERCHYPDPNQVIVRVACGARGVYHFSRSALPTQILSPPLQTRAAELPACETADHLGEEVLVFYSPTPVAKTAALEPTGVAFSMRTGLAGGPTVPGNAAGGANYPCEAGECLTPLEDIYPGDEWNALVDWADEHGKPVAQTIKTMGPAGYKVVLFPLDDEGPDPLQLGGVTDLQVLQRLCDIVEAVEPPRGVAPKPAPKVLTMAFGRHRDDPSWADTACCDPDLLGCQIGKVLAHLAYSEGSLRTLPAAAAGNHRTPLYPASYDVVTSVGAMDQRAYQELGESGLPNWETPQQEGEFDALLPGLGLCFSLPGGGTWSNPAGSSYSTAVFSGLMAAALVNGSVQDPFTGGLWTLNPPCGFAGCSWSLSNQAAQHIVFKEAANSLLSAALWLGDACGPPGGAEQYLEVEVSEITPEELFVLPPAFVELLGVLNRPQPEPTVCVPCEDGEDDPEFNSLRASKIFRESRFLIDLSGGTEGIEGLLLQAVYVRMDAGFAALDLTPQQLSDLLAGQIQGLSVGGQNIGKLVYDSVRQPSLVFLLNGDAESDITEPFWTSTPLLLRGG